MRKSKQILGMPVISLEEGRQIGNIRGIVLNPARKCVAALIIEKRGFFSEQKFVPFSKVRSIGEDAVTLERGGHAEKGASLPEILTLYKERVNVTGTRIVAENGTFLGVANDYYINLDTGELLGLEFSGGPISSFFRGKAFLDIEFIKIMGPAVTVCSDSATEKVIKMEDGLYNTLKSCSQATARVLEGTVQKSKVLGKSVSRSVKSLKPAKTKEEDPSFQQAPEPEMPTAGDTGPDSRQTGGDTDRDKDNKQD